MSPTAHLAKLLLTVASCTLLLAGLSGCDALFGGEEDGPTGVAARGVDESCSSGSECRTGLSCSAGTCQPQGNQLEGGSCTLSAECQPDLFCQYPFGAGSGICAASGEGTSGDTCQTSADCSNGLFCNIRGLVGLCTESGEGDIGASCSDTSACLAGLACVNDLCASIGVPAGIPVFGGVACDPALPDDSEPIRVLFDVPRSDEVETEFYRLPFPNDIRLRDGHLDVTSHPAPDLEDVGNILGTINRVISEDVDGYGLHQAIFFRFNRFFQSDSMQLSGDDPTLFLVNIDPESPQYGRRSSLSFTANSASNGFICQNWLSVRPFWNEPFQPNTTYAVIITDRLRGNGGQMSAPSEDFALMTGLARPANADLAAAWEHYAPLREYLVDQNFSVDRVVGAAVFTTGNPTRHLEGIAAEVEDNGPPSFEDFVLCDGETTSPCDDGLEGDEHVRGCFEVSGSFYELHTRLDIPNYQEGSAPYFETGGAVLFNGAGRPIQNGTQSVCTTVLIPKDREMPEGGWPVVVYAHGTGGNFRSVVGQLGESLSDIGYAAVGFEGVAHGSRRGDSDLSPDVLFFNVLNPRAAAGNVLQGAIDVMSYGLWAENFSLGGGASPIGEAIAFDPDRVVFFGHSQGATVGVPGLAARTHYDAAVISGGGGGLLLSLLNKRSPVDIAGGIELLLGASANDFHPVLNLIQMYFEPVDALNYAPFLRENEGDGPGLHIFQTLGIGDTYTPDATMQELARALDLPILEGFDGENFGRPEASTPLSGNFDSGQTTAALGQYTPPTGRDGHFVVFDNPDARTQMLGFISSLRTSLTPTIPAE
ncbi:MAG: hypothetical protein KC561_00410 [Myxococcales bacterium]|nr:hypothetical protein [Myxococcales bacterium]